MYNQNTIRGEYWIRNGYVDFADGDVSDRNHAMIAREYICNQYSDNIENLANNLGIDASSISQYGEINTEAISQVLEEIEEKLQEQEIEDTHDYILKYIGCNNEAYNILLGGGNEILYVMKYEGWIAVREMNIELFGYDNSKRLQLVRGLEQILDEEGIDENVPPEEIEFWIEDHKTNRSHATNMAELQEPITMRANKMITSTRIKPLPTFKTNADSEENKGQNPSPSVQNPWNKAAIDKKIIPPGHQLWRGTSECTIKLVAFKEWLKKYKS